MEEIIVDNIITSHIKVKSLTTEIGSNGDNLELESTIDRSWIITSINSHIIIRGRYNHILILNSNNCVLELDSTPVSSIDIIHSSNIIIHVPSIDVLSGELSTNIVINGKTNYIVSNYSMGWILNGEVLFINPLEYQIYDNNSRMMFNGITPTYIECTF